MRFSAPYISNNLKGQGLIFYCKDCEKVVDVIPVGRKFVYKCAICKTKNVAFGTEKSIRNFFHLPEDTTPATPPASPAPSAAPSPTPTVTIPKASAEPAVDDKPTEPNAPTPIPENK